jgi:hypothetical protein
MINGKKPRGNDDFGTPDWLYKPLNNKFAFTVDASAGMHNSKVFKLKITHPNIIRGDTLTELVPSYFDDALKESWEGHRVFCNPPYSRKFEFIEYAKKEIIHCPIAVMILPFTLEVYREIKDFHYDVLPQRVSFIDPVTGLESKGNTTGTVIVYFWGVINKPKSKPPAKA